MAAKSKILGNEIEYNPQTQKWQKTQNACHACGKPEIKCFVNIPKDLSYSNAARWDWKPIDNCIADLVNALNRSGILTSSSCCGHKENPGSIILQDGRVLGIFDDLTDFYKHRGE